MLEEIERRLSHVSRITGGVGVCGLLVVAVLTVADILARWLANAPLAGVDDISKLTIIVVIAACFSAGLFERRQIQIQFLGSALGARASAIFDAFGAIATTVMFALMTWQVAIYAADVTSTGETTFLLRIPVGPVWWIATILLAACIPMQAIVSLSEIVRAITRAGPPDRPQDRSYG